MGIISAYIVNTNNPTVTMSPDNFRMQTDKSFEKGTIGLYSTVRFIRILITSIIVFYVIAPCL